MVFGRDVKVSVAFKAPTKPHRKYQASREFESFHRSRSRSPQRKDTDIVLDLKSKIKAYIKDNKKLEMSISSLQKEIDFSNEAVTEAKEQNFRRSLDLDVYEKKAQISLPCGHFMIIQKSDINFIDELFEVAVMKLSEADRRNNAITQILKSQILDKVQQQRPEIYNCQGLVPMTIPPCNHTTQVKCWEVKLYEDGVKELVCQTCSKPK